MKGRLKKRLQLPIGILGIGYWIGGFDRASTCEGAAHQSDVILAHFSVSPYLSLSRNLRVFHKEEDKIGNIGEVKPIYRPRCVLPLHCYHIMLIFDPKPIFN